MTKPGKDIFNQRIHQIMKEMYSPKTNHSLHLSRWIKGQDWGDDSRIMDYIEFLISEKLVNEDRVSGGSHTLSHKGLGIMREGGYMAHIKKIHERESRQISLQKLSIEVNKLQSKEIPKASKRACLGLIIAFLSLIISLLAVFLK